jgi:transposase
LEYGHEKDHPDPEQLNMGMVLERNRRIPPLYLKYTAAFPML